MKHHLGFLLACSIVFGSPAFAAGTGGIFLNAGSNGAIELSNLSGEPGDEVVAAAAEAPATPAPANEARASSANVSPIVPQSVESRGLAESSKTVELADAAQISPNEQYRNHVQQQLQGSAQAMHNPAVSRRYLMQTRSQMAANGLY